MSIAEKLTTIAENEPKIYKKGKTDFGSKRSVSGEYLCIYDISPAEKSIDVTLTSDTVTDFSDTKLTACGKNLFDSNKLLECKDWAEENGVYIGNSAYTHEKWGTESVIDAFEPDTRYTLSFDGYHINDANNSNSSLHVHMRCTDGWASTLFINSNEMKHFVITSPAGKTVKSINISYGYGYKVFISNFQVTKSAIEEEYEPYTGAEYRANDDGTVNGIVTCYPITNIFTNSNEAVINTQYYLDVPYEKGKEDFGYKKSVSGSGIHINDVSPVEHELNVKVSNAAAKVLKYGGNILDIEGREVVNFGAVANTTQRTFTGKGIIKGFAYSGYYNPLDVTSFEKHKNGFSFSNEANKIPYGIGFDFKSAPNITYIARYDGVKDIGTTATIFFTEYDKDGKFLRGSYMPKYVNNKEAWYFTTGENVAWVVISFQNTVAETVVDFDNVYIGIGNSFSGYEEYKEPVIYTPNADGTVEGVKSLYPNMTLLTDTQGVVIHTNYYADSEKIIQNLTDTIISLGGDI